MNNWKVILATLVIFGAGVVTGGLLVHHAYRVSQGSPRVAQEPPSHHGRPETVTKETSRASNPPGQHMLGSRKDFLKNLDQELQLTAEQRERIEKVLCQGQEQTRQLWEKISPEMKEEWKYVKERIRAELTEEQKARFDKCMKSSHKKEEQHQPVLREDFPAKDTFQPATQPDGSKP